MLVLIQKSDNVLSGKSENLDESLKFGRDCDVVVENSTMFLHFVSSLLSYSSSKEFSSICNLVAVKFHSDQKIVH